MARAGAVGRAGLVAMLLTIVIGSLSVPVASAAKLPKYPFSGYITSSMVVTVVTATVSLPALACTKKTSAITAAATVFDASNGDMTSALVYLGCAGKHATYAAYADVNNVTSVVPISLKAGDLVTLTTTCGSSGVSVVIDDDTHGAAGTASSTTTESCTQAETGDGAVVNNDGTAADPLPAFGTIAFSAVMVNGSPLGSVPDNAVAYKEGKKEVIGPGPLSDGGTAFTTTEMSGRPTR